RDRPEAARFADGDAKLDALRPCHRGLDDRQARGKPFARHEALRVPGFAGLYPAERGRGQERSDTMSRIRLVAGTGTAQIVAPGAAAVLSRADLPAHRSAGEGHMLFAVSGLENCPVEASDCRIGAV